MFDRKVLQEERMPVYRKVVKGMWILLGLGMFLILAIFIGLSFSDLPDTQELENPKSTLASEVFASNGEVLGRYFR